MPDPAIQQLIAEAELAQEAARTHKRAASHHRRQAHAHMARLDAIRRECARRGINLQITETPRRASE